MVFESSSINTSQKVKFSTPAKPMQPNSTSKIRVIARVRPLLPHEIETQNGNHVPCVSILEQDHEPGKEVTVHLKDQYSNRNECYKLDSFFGREDNNVSQIFYSEVCPLIPGIFYGCNATVFAYGATGSGKTYTMEGTDELPGLMPMSVLTILSMCQCMGSTAEISYYEVYMDKCFDLLEIKGEEIAVWDDEEGQIHLRGLSRVPANSMTEFQKAFYCAIQRRKVGHTGLNDVSSRSHGVLVISVSTPLADGSGAVVTGKLNLIDLAGNEDNRRTGNEGVRLQESAKINQSLFALSNVIHALNNNTPRVPYRESKLTRILQDSLGGTSRALMVACLNPGEYFESVRTVQLAARSRHISNFPPSTQEEVTPKVKVDMEAKLTAWLESKGKTKSTQRRVIFGSSSLNRNPRPMSSVEIHSIFHTNSKPKAGGHRGASSVKNREISGLHRNLFNNGCRADSFMEMTIPSNMEQLRNCGVMVDAKAIEDGSVKTLSTAVNNSLLDPSAEDDSGELIKPAADLIVLESKPHLSDEQEKETTMKPRCAVGSSPTRERAKAFQSSPLRKVLSPIDANVSRREPIGILLSKDQIFSFEPMTPETPSAFTSERNKFQSINTPLDKFTARSSNIKSSLAQEYIDFLNEASLEELVEIKGIGMKRAEYIIGLRETTPLKSLSDLEKIGLSSKQVQNLFSTAARGIFI